MIRKRYLLAMVVTIAASIATAAPVAAQVQTGSILVTAVDEQGGVMPGASVAITSPVLPRELVGTTDERGVYRVPGLPVAKYTVKVSLQGFQTVIREDVNVLQGQTANIELSMKVSTLAEAITVKGESPVVDTRTVGSSTNISGVLLETTPGGKDIWNTLEYKAPGVVVEGADVGGNQGGLQRSMSSRGTPNAQNTQLLNGVNVNDPAAQGFAMNYYIPTVFENVQVSTGAQDIAVGTGGILINMVTKSGTNRFSGEALQTYQGAKTEASNVNSDLQAFGLRPDANSTALLTNSNVQVGGPLVKNKLFYFGSWNYQATHVKVPLFPAVVPSYIESPLADTSNEDTTDILAGEGKITYQANVSNRFEGYLSKQRYDKPNRGSGATVTQDSNSKELDTFVIAQLSHNVVLGDRMFLDSKISYNNTHFPLLQKTDLQPITDNSTGILYRNRGSSAEMFRRRLQVVSNFQYFLPNFLAGRHEFKVGFDNGFTPEDVDTTRVDDVNLVYLSSPTPRASTVQIFNSPLHVERAVMSTALYGQDGYTIGRLNVIGGVRWERIEGYLPAQTTPSSTYFPEGLVFQNVTINNVVQNYTVRKSFPAVKENPLWYNVAPRVAATYALTADSRTALKVSWGKYLDQINTGTPPNPNANINQTYVWNDLNGDLKFQPGNAAWDGGKYVGGEFGTLNTTSNLSVAVFDKSVKRPYRNELTVSVDREILPNLLLTVAYLHTREHDVQTTIDQSFDLWNTLYSPVNLTEPGRDGVLGTSDDAPITVYTLNQGAVTNTKTVNDDRVATRYDGLDLIVDKRFSRGFTMLAGYTYSRTRQDFAGLNNPNNLLVFSSGESGGRRHNFKASGSKELPYKINFAANFRLQSGLPTTRQWTYPACSATITANCARTSATVNTEPRGSFELPWLPTLDIRVGKYFNIGTQRVELSIDGYNFTNANTTYTIRTGSGLSPVRVAGDPTNPTVNVQTFNSPTAILAPRVFRFNVSYKFGQR